MSSTFDKELADIMLYVEGAISRSLLKEEKREPYSWLRENGLHEVSKHILAYQQNPDEEHHLDSAIYRLATVLVKRKMTNKRKNNA